MDFNAQPIGIYIRIVAIISLLLGLNDAARLLGVNLGDVSPIAAMGMTGLWIKASWGAVLLVGATAVELALHLLGNPDVRMSAFGFAVRIVLLASILIIFVLSVRHSRARAAD